MGYKVETCVKHMNGLKMMFSIRSYMRIIRAWWLST